MSTVTFIVVNFMSYYDSKREVSLNEKDQEKLIEQLDRDALLNQSYEDLDKGE